MRWTPAKAWTSQSNVEGYRHFELIGQGGKRDGRWVELVAVLDQRCRHRVSWKELSDPELWRSGWQQLPNLEDGEGVS